MGGQITKRIIVIGVLRLRESLRRTDRRCPQRSDQYSQSKQKETTSKQQEDDGVTGPLLVAGCLVRRYMALDMALYRQIVYLTDQRYGKWKSSRAAPLCMKKKRMNNFQWHIITIRPLQACRACSKASSTDLNSEYIHTL